jgi:predicted alpha/beta hydrolase family esterase
MVWSIQGFLFVKISIINICVKYMDLNNIFLNFNKDLLIKGVYLALITVIIFIMYYVLKFINEKIIFLPSVSLDRTLIISTKNMIECKIKKNNIILHGLLYNQNKTPSFKDNIILYSHGNAGNISSLVNCKVINTLSKKFTVFIYDYQGYGLSTGAPSENNAYDDIQNVWDYLTIIKKVKPNQIVLYGHSLGTAITTKFIENLCSSTMLPEDLPKCIILEAPFLNIKTMAEKILGKLCATMFVVLKFDNLNNIKKIEAAKISIPIYILHSKNDEIIPFEQGKILSETFDFCKFFEITGGHNDANIESVDMDIWWK